MARKLSAGFGSFEYNSLVFAVWIESRAHQSNLYRKADRIAGIIHSELTLHALRDFLRHGQTDAEAGLFRIVGFILTIEWPTSPRQAS